MFQPTNLLISEVIKSQISADSGGDNPGAFAGAKVGLFTNTPVLTEETTIADLVEPTYSGYTRTAITGLSGASRDPSGNWFIFAPPVNFPFDGSTPGVVVTGTFVVDASTPGKLLGVTLFDTPRALTDFGDSVFVEIEFGMSQAGFVYGPNID